MENKNETVLDGLIRVRQELILEYQETEDEIRMMKIEYELYLIEQSILRVKNVHTLVV